MTKYFTQKITYYYFLVIALAAQRFLHFKNIIDEPHSWRQFDTLYYAFSFYQNGFNILKPSVCWMGGYKTLILEFPLVSYIIALIYYIFTPSVFWARLVPFLFYLSSFYYLYLVIKFLFYPRLARITAILYLMFPISLFYSRAVQIDFGAMFFSLGMFYYYLKGLDKENIAYIILGSVLGSFAFLIKAPYSFYLYLPLMYFIYSKSKFKYFLKTLPIMMFPITAFLIWELYSVKINSSAPDWYFIPDYFKFDNMSIWYFGSIFERLQPENWKNIFFVFVESATSYIGIIFFISGLFLPLEKYHKKTIFYFYLTGIIVYIIVFFNLILIHDYYQTPLLVVSSFFMAVSIDYIYRKIKTKYPITANITTGFIIIILSVNCIWFTERWYYNVDKIREEASQIIDSSTPEVALVIVSIKDTDPRDPRILAPSYRNGWSIKLSDLNKELIEKLVTYGAGYLALITDKKIEPDLTSFPSKVTFKEFSLYDNKSKLYLYTFKP